MGVINAISRQIGESDIALGTGSYAYQDINGVVQTIAKVNAGSFPLANYPSLTSGQVCERWVDARAFSSIGAAVTAIGSDSATLYLSAQAWTVNVATTVPANIHLWIDNGALLSVTALLTISGPFWCGPYQVFNCSGAGSVSFTSGVVSPEWWGALADGATDDAAALNAALLACKKIHLIKSKSYAFASRLNVTLDDSYISGGGELLQIATVTPYNGLYVTADGFSLDDIVVTGANQGYFPIAGGTWSDLDTFGAAVYLFNCDRGTVRNCIISDWGNGVGDPLPGGMTPTGAGVYASGSTNCQVIGNRIDNCSLGIGDDDFGHTDIDPHLSIKNQYYHNNVTNSKLNGIAVDASSSAATTDFSYGVDVSHNSVSGSKVYSGIVFTSYRGGGNCTGNVSYGNATVGYELKENCNGLNFDGNYGYNNTSHGVLIWSTTGALSPALLEVKGGQFFANGGDGVNVATGYLISCDAFIHSNTGYGIYAHHLIGGEFKGQVILNGLDGVYLSSCQGITVRGHIAANGQSASDTYSGLHVVKDDFSCTGIVTDGTNFCGNSVYPVQTQKYAVVFGDAPDGGASGCKIINCEMQDSLTAPYVDNFVGTIISNNSPSIQVIPFAVGIATDLSKGPWIYIDAGNVLGATMTINNPTNGGYGQRFRYEVKKGTNALTIAWGPNFKTAISSLTASKQAIYEFIYDGSSFRQVGTPVETDP